MMASTTRVACDEESDGNGGKSNGYEGDGRATAMSVMAKVNGSGGGNSKSNDDSNGSGDDS
jgi:hypothetical protein